MGYYTYFTLEDVSEGNKSKHEEAIGLASVYECSELFEESIKWYTFDKDIRAYSLKHPGVLFTISGDGEESDDKWTSYIRDGKIHEVRAKVTYDEFDETKLK